MGKENIEKLLPGVKKNILLKNHTTFKIGGIAEYFFVARNTKDIIKAVLAAKKCKLKFFILAGGSNLLVSDKGFDGLVINIQNTKYRIEKETVYTEAGVPFTLLVMATTKLGLKGLEWAAGIPGTLGGAIAGNAGAFRGEIKDSISEVEILDEKGKIRKLSKTQCKFSYRESVFKKKNWIILSVVLKLKKGNKKELQVQRDNIIQYRKEKYITYPSAGSVFKNCDLKKVSKKTKDFFAEKVKKDPFPLIPAAVIIAKAGLKGLKVGDAQVFKSYPNFIVNLGKASSSDVKKLISLIKAKVKKKFKIILKEEIRFVGF
ncbi:UDP-N-acetylmuramate dehydrogenase [Patescibacteria group bacterium]